MDKQKFSTRDITSAAIIAALVFIATYTFKIPAPNGYTHLGDCMIFIGVLVLGSRKGALAGGIGAALADAVGGYSEWIIPTFFIKGLMALIMGLFTYKLLKNNRFGWLVGAVVGGIVQITLYTVVKIPFSGLAYALTRLPGNIAQTFIGIAAAGVIITVLNEGGIINKLRVREGAA